MDQLLNGEILLLVSKAVARFSLDTGWIPSLIWPDIVLLWFVGFLILKHKLIGRHSKDKYIQANIQISIFIFNLRVKTTFFNLHFLQNYLLSFSIAFTTHNLSPLYIVDLNAESWWKKHKQSLKGENRTSIISHHCPWESASSQDLRQKLWQFNFPFGILQCLLPPASHFEWSVWFFESWEDGSLRYWQVERWMHCCSNMIF